MSGLTNLQDEVARTLFGPPESAGSALAGGSAHVELGVIDRPTRDLDAFVAARAGDSPGDIGPPAAALSAKLAPQDLAARKVLAVPDRAEGRDFTDLWTLAREHGQTETIAWVRQLDDGVTATQISAAFDQLARLRDDELPCESSDRPIVREWFTTWSEHLRSTLG